MLQIIPAARLVQLIFCKARGLKIRQQNQVWLNASPAAGQRSPSTLTRCAASTKPPGFSSSRVQQPRGFTALLHSASSSSGAATLRSAHTSVVNRHKETISRRVDRLCHRLLHCFAAAVSWFDDQYAPHQRWFPAACSAASGNHHHAPFIACHQTTGWLPVQRLTSKSGRYGYSILHVERSQSPEQTVKFPRFNNATRRYRRRGQQNGNGWSAIAIVMINSQVFLATGY